MLAEFSLKLKFQVAQAKKKENPQKRNFYSKKSRAH